MKNYDRLEKFMGKATKLNLKDADGENQEFNLYKLPVLFMPKLMKLQKVSDKISKARKIDPTAELSVILNADEERDFLEGVKDTVSLVLAYSMAREDGLITRDIIDGGYSSVEKVIEPYKNKIEMCFTMDGFLDIFSKVMDSNKVEGQAIKAESGSFQEPVHQ